MKAKLIIVIITGLVFAGCTPPVPSLYIRNFSETSLDLVVIFHGAVPDSAFNGLALLNGLAIERSVPIPQSKPHVDQLSAKGFKITIPSERSLLLPASRTLTNGMFDSSTVLLVKDHYLVDTLFHKNEYRYLQKFKTGRRFFFTHQLFYDFGNPG